MNAIASFLQNLCTVRTANDPLCAVFSRLACSKCDTSLSQQ